LQYFLYQGSQPSQSAHSLALEESVHGIGDGCHQKILRIECIGSWLREGHIQPLNRNGMGLVMMTDVEAGGEDDREDIDDDDLEEL
jgi:hypothetical protein